MLSFPVVHFNGVEEITSLRGKIGEGPSRNRYRGHMDKAKGGRFEGGRWGWVQWGAVVG